MKNFALALFLLFFAGTSYSQIEINEASSDSISNKTKIRGPKFAIVTLSSCKFSATLTSNQHLLYDGLSIILYQSETALPRDELPYVSQTQTHSGYDWFF